MSCSYTAIYIEEASLYAVSRGKRPHPWYPTSSPALSSSPSAVLVTAVFRRSTKFKNKSANTLSPSPDVSKITMPCSPGRHVVSFQCMYFHQFAVTNDEDFNDSNGYDLSSFNIGTYFLLLEVPGTTLTLYSTSASNRVGFSDVAHFITLVIPRTRKLAFRPLYTLNDLVSLSYQDQGIPPRFDSEVRSPGLSR